MTGINTSGDGGSTRWAAFTDMLPLEGNLELGGGSFVDCTIDCWERCRESLHVQCANCARVVFDTFAELPQ